MKMRFFDRFRRFNQVSGLNIQVNEDGHLEINLCVVVADGDMLSIDKKVSGIESLNDIRKYCPEKSIMSVNLTGRGIIIKTIPDIKEIGPEEFSSIFPNADMTDFYIQQYISSNLSYLSIIRKNEADKILTALSTFGFYPMLLSLGPFPVENILSQMNFYDAEIVFAGHIINKGKDSEWIKYSYIKEAHTSFPIKIENDEIDESLILSYAAAWQLILYDRISVINIEVPNLHNQRSIALLKKDITLKALFLLSGLFATLLINILLLQHFNRSNADLNIKISQNAQFSLDNKALTESISRNQRLIKSIGWDGIKKSFYVDQLAQLMPLEIQWDNVEINPVDIAETRRTKQTSFADRLIRIHGNCQSMLPINEYVERVKTIKWVKSIKLETFQFNQDLNTGIFTITVNY